LLVFRYVFSKSDPLSCSSFSESLLVKKRLFHTFFTSNSCVLSCSVFVLLLSAPLASQHFIHSGRFPVFPSCQRSQFASVWPLTVTHSCQVTPLLSYVQLTLPVRTNSAQWTLGLTAVTNTTILPRDIHGVSGFGDLKVACWPLVPKFAGSHPAESVGFLGRKNLQHALIRRRSKAAGLMSQLYGV
jgi:hypothetical protein